MYEILDVFNLILSVVINASRSMILQAESKREYEEVSVKEAVETAVFYLLYCFISSSKDICCCWYKYQSNNNGGAVETYLCGFSYLALCLDASDWPVTAGISQVISGGLSV